MADEETTPILLVFVGSRIDSNGTGLDDYWLLVTPDEFESGIAPENKYRSYGKLHRIDWLVSGDDGEDTFHARWKEDMAALDRKSQ